MSKKNQIPSIRVTDAERAAVEKRAAAAGVSLTDYIRNTVIGGQYDGVPILGTIEKGKVVVFPGVCQRCLGFGEVRGIEVAGDQLVFGNKKPCPMCREGEAA